tara:strand:- start:307 stop:498 length:192 start_codon:yes stop_codon:yes gene_type:complete
MVFKGLQKDLIQQPEPNSRRQRQAAFFLRHSFWPRSHSERHPVFEDDSATWANHKERVTPSSI